MTEASFDIDEAVVIKDENVFLVSLRNASMPIEGHHGLGLYYNDCRFLSGWELEVLGDRQPLLACATTNGDSATYALAKHEPTVGLQIEVVRDLSRPRTLDERITVTNFDAEPLVGEVTLRMRSRFEPILWLRGLVDGYQPQRPSVTAHAGGLTVAVIGADGIERKLMTTARPVPASANGQTLSWQLELRRGHPQTIALRHVVDDGEGVRVPAAPAPRRRRSGRTQDAPAQTCVTTDCELFNRILERSLADLRMLRSRLGRDRYFAAGIPWYATVFGRDTLITSIEMLAYQPQIAEETLRLLAGNLGRTVDAERDEEPGKVLHELRGGELANLGLLPFARYYGTVDATPLFLCLLAEHADWSGELALFSELSGAVDAALEWIDRWGDRDGDGLLEYKRAAPGGLENQGWKDSPDGIPDERGEPLRGTIALAEVQGYAVQAKRRLARLFEVAGQTRRAAQLRQQAGEPRDHIERLWLEDERFYSMALDGEKRPSRALASNQGHLLWSFALPRERAAHTRDALMRPEMFSGWGIRTLSAREPSYNPLGYHTGSVWPHDSALTAVGLRKYGHDEDFARVFEGLLAAASRLPDYRLPELFGGFSRAEHEIPVPYPVACRPQAWAAGAIPYLLTAGLGLVPDGLERRLHVVRPWLPGSLTHVELRDLQIAGSKVELVFERDGDVVTLADARTDGDVEVTLEPSVGRQSTPVHCCDSR